jgi:hypothetical protein
MRKKMSGASESALVLVTSDLPCYVAWRLCAWVRPVCYEI